MTRSVFRWVVCEGENAGNGPLWGQAETLFTAAKTWKQLKRPSTEERTKKMWCVYIHTMEYYSAKKRNEIVPSVATRTDVEIIAPSQRTTNV